MAFLCAGLIGLCQVYAAEVRSLDGRILFTVELDADGRPACRVDFDTKTVVGASRLGIRFRERLGLDTAMREVDAKHSMADTSSEQPRGERRVVRDRYNELVVTYASTDEAARDLHISLQFLDENRVYLATLYRDGANAGWRANPYDFVVEELEVDRCNQLKLKLAAGGGAAIRFRPKPEAG